jgi:putative tricarboxylic transport membrane protein
MLHNAFIGILGALELENIIMTLFGVVTGVVIGCLPGLTSVMGVALLIPVTFGMDPTAGLAMLGGVYCASTYGGAISAILLNIPGTPSACVTTIDGYPLALKGESGRAISMATLGSCVGGIFSTFVLLFVAPPLAKISLLFSAHEYFLLSLLGITIIASFSDQSVIKGLMAGTLGLFMSVVGMHPMTGYMRFTGGMAFLVDGIPLVVALIGFFSLPEVLNMVADTSEDRKGILVYTGHPMKYFKELLSHWLLVIKSSVIGTIIGIIPGAGTDIAAFLAYNEAKRASKDKESFGKGAIEGVIASETSNNAVVGGSLVPLLTLGIPGNAVSAIFLGALLIQGLRPGFELFQNTPEIVYGFICSMFVANILFVPVGFIIARYAYKLLKTPVSLLAPTIIVFAVIGSYAIRNNMEDLWLMLLMGFVGYLMQYFSVPVAPMVLGLVLGAMSEGELARAYALSNDSVYILLKDFITRPICIILIVLSVFSVWQGIRRSLETQKKEIVS